MVTFQPREQQGSADGSVDRSAYPFGPDLNISKTIGWIAMKFGKPEWTVITSMILAPS